MKKIFSEIKKFFKDPLFLKRWESDYEPRNTHFDQISIPILTGRRGKEYLYKGDCFMFVQDMYIGLIPYREETNYPTKLEPFNSTKSEMIANGISNRYSTHDLSDALRDFIETTAHVIFQNGSAIYEIVCEKNEEEEITSFNLALIQQESLYKIFGNYYQVITWKEAKLSRRKAGIIRIPASKILRIDMPKQLGGPRGFRKMLKKLWNISKELSPNFYMESLAEGINTGFDFNDYIRCKYLEVASLTQKFGWDQRQRGSKYLTEFDFMMSYIRRKKARILVREKIIKELNAALNDVPLNLGCKVKIENLPNIEDVEKEKEKLESGNVKFIEIYEELKAA